MRRWIYVGRTSHRGKNEQQILMALDGLERQSPESLPDGVRILELANKAYFLYLKQPPAEKAKLLRIVLSNCKIDAASVGPTYRKPFDVIFQRVRKEEWLPESYDLRTLRFEVPRTLHSQGVRCADVPKRL